MKYILILILFFSLSFSSALLLSDYDSKYNSLTNYSQIGYSSPKNVFDNERLFFSLSQNNFQGISIDDTISFNVNVNQSGAFIWKQGYYYNNSSQQWVAFDLQGTRIKLPGTNTDSDWIGSSASKQISIKGRELVSGFNPIVTYVCVRHNEKWKCGCNSLNEEGQCNRWSLQYINVSGSLATGGKAQPLPVGERRTLVCQKNTTLGHIQNSLNYCNINFCPSGTTSFVNCFQSQAYNPSRTYYSWSCRQTESQTISCSVNPSCPQGYAVVQNQTC